MVKYKLTPEQYQEILVKLTLQEIRLISSNMKFIEEDNENALELIIDEKLTHQDSGDIVNFFSSFSLIASGKSNKKEVILIDCVYKAVYSKSTDVKISSSETSTCRVRKNSTWPSSSKTFCPRRLPK